VFFGENNNNKLCGLDYVVCESWFLNVKYLNYKHFFRNHELRKKWILSCMSCTRTS
jgi:hypothetical protein